MLLTLTLTLTLADSPLQALAIAATAAAASAEVRRTLVAATPRSGTVALPSLSSTSGTQGPVEASTTSLWWGESQGCRTAQGPSTPTIAIAIAITSYPSDYLSNASPHLA